MSDIKPEDLQSLTAVLSQGDQRGAAVSAATGGYSTGVDQALARRKAEFQQKLEAAGLVDKQRDTVASEAKVGLAFKLAQQPSTVYDPAKGTTTNTPALSGIDFKPGVGLTETPTASVGEKAPKLVPTPPEKPSDIAIFDQDAGKFYNQDGSERTIPVDPKTTKVINRSRSPEAADTAKRETKLTELKKTVGFFQQKFAELNRAPGPGGKIQGAEQAVQGRMGLNPQAAAYRASLSGLRSQIARGLGEVGNLAENEQKVAMDLLPGELDDSATADAKIKNFLDYIDQKTGAKASPTTPGQTGEGESIHTYPSGRKIKLNRATNKWEPYDGK